MKTSFMGIAFLLYFIYECALIVRASLTRSSRKSPQVPRKKTYWPSIIRISRSTAVALIAAYACGITVLGSARIDHKSALLGSAFLILNLCLDPLEWKFTPDERKKPIANFLPRTARERVAWVFVSITAGVGQEIIFRAVLFGIVFQLTGNYWIAAAVSGVLFALGHFPYGLMAMVDLFVVALCLQWLVKISGGLYIAMGIHFVHNFYNGIVWGALNKPEPDGGTGIGSEPLNGHLDVAAPSVPNTDAAEM